MHLSLSADRLPKPVTIDLIEVRRLVYSCRNPGRALSDQPRLLGGQVCQDLDIGDGIGKRESISAPHLQRPQHFQLFAIGLRKTELPLADPDICDQELVRDASNELIHSWFVVHPRGEPRKISSPHNPSIEKANETLHSFAEGDTGLHQQPVMSGHASGEPAIMREWRRSRDRGGKCAGLVYGTEFSWIALDPASHQGSVVIGITIWTPRYSRPLPHRVEEDGESATLISCRVEILIVLRGELVVCEERNRMAWTFPIKLDTRRKDMDRYIGIIPEFHRPNVTCEMPGWRRDPGNSAQRGPRRGESFQHLLSLPPVSYQPHIIST